MQKQAFLFLSHQSSRAIRAEFARIEDGSSQFGDAYWTYHQREGRPLPAPVRANPNYSFTDASIEALDYPKIGPGLIPGHAHYPVLQFFRSHPGYAYYWVIEYDVRYTGPWHRFFSTITEAFAHDFVGCHLRRYADEPAWEWWSSLSHPTTEIPRSEQVRSFNPIFRISSAGLHCLHDAHRDGWKGHNEVVLPTLLSHSGLSIADFGGDGAFVPDGFQNRVYTSGIRSGQLRTGTMRYRPASWRPGPAQNKLHHPVKPLPTVLRMNLDGAWTAARSRLRDFRRRAPNLRPH